MEKKPFYILLIFELFADMIAMGLLFSDLGALIYLIAAVLFALVLTPFFICLAKAKDEARKARIRRNMLLVMLIPAAIAIVVVLAVVVTMLAYF